VGLKVSDEFVVPLCAVHHRENHATGDERRWWHERNLDPLAIAGELWRQSRTPNGLIATPGPVRESEQLLPGQRVDSAKPQEV
jgi:hypothetical protein